MPLAAVEVCIQVGREKKFFTPTLIRPKKRYLTQNKGENVRKLKLSFDLLIPKKKF